MMHITVDGRQVEAAAGVDVLRACLDAGVYVPHLCAHPDLPASGGCRLCVVEVDGVDGPVQACETPVADGLVVRTRTPEVEAIRALALELVLAPHPKDCTSCAAYLNCELQALMQYMGVVHSRLREIDKSTATVGHSDTIFAKEMFRCIQCTRCIRACDDLRGVGILTLNERDGEVFVGPRDDVGHELTDCRFCGACVEVCPTGSIMDAPGLFRTDVPKAQAMVPCQNNCPAHTDIPLYLKLAGEGRYADSVSVFREKLTFPLSLGYVCSHVCESDCKRGRLDDPLSIRSVKRFAVENDTEQRWRSFVAVAPSTGRRVAVVGGGPAGLTSAYYLTRKGHAVTVLERQARPGGMLTHGIPVHRLPREVVEAEIGILRADAPFEIETGVDVTDAPALLGQGYDAVVVAVGAQAGRRPGEFEGPWPNVLDGVDLCRRWSEGDDCGLSGAVVVVGGGNVAFDCARIATRAGTDRVSLVCLEPRAALLADPEEVEAAEAEGVQVTTSVAPSPVSTSPGAALDTRLGGVRVQPISGFRFGAQGLELDVEGPARELLADWVVVATGQQTDLTDAFGVGRRPGGLVLTGPDGRTDRPGVFAAGDVVSGTSSVVAAIAAARAVASAVDRHLGGDGDVEDHFYDRTAHDPVLGTVPGFAWLHRTDCHTPEAVTAEASRCLRCDLRRDIQPGTYWTDPAYQGARR
jgi:formate dehydrogenase beta subunit